MHVSQSTPCNCLALRQAARHVSQFYDQALAPFGLRATQFSILGRLQNSGPWTIQALAAKLVLDRTTLGRTIRPLERDGLVAMETDPGDRRVRALRITRAGEKLYAEALQGWQMAQQRFEAAVGEAEAATLRSTLKAVASRKF